MLFPSASKCDDDDKKNGTRTRDPRWLENKSFTSETAKKVVEFQKELNALQGNLPLDENNDDNDITLDIKPKKAEKTLDNQVIINLQTQQSKYKKKKKKRKHYASDSSLSEDDRGGKDYDRSESRSRHYEDKKKKYNYEDMDFDHGRDSKGKILDTKDTYHHRRKHTKKKERSRPSTSDSSSSSGDDKYERKKKKKKHKKHKKEESKSEDVQRESIPNRPELFTPNAVFYEDLTSDIALEDAFRVDRKSDKNSLTYGSLYKQHIAQYKLICYSCMGTRQGEELDLKDKKKNKKIKTSRYFDKENRKIVKQMPLEVITLNQKQPNVETQDNDKSENILILESSVIDNKHDRTDIRDQILDQSTALFVLGKPASSYSTDPSEDVKVQLRTATQAKVIYFNQSLKETPNDIQLWLDFVKLQDVVFSENDSFGGLSSGFDGRLTRAVIEKKISIIDKALQANPGNIDLVLHKLELSGDLVDAKVINKELEQLLFVHSANTQLWRYYLNHNQSRLSLFTVTRMIKLYHKCFKVLFAIIEGKVQTHSVPESLCKDVLDIFIEYCYFLKQSGHREKATGSLQALVEYNIFCPSTLRNVSKETKMAGFEEFWDSEVPRAGCEDAPGWNTWFNDKDSTHHCPPQTDNLEEIEEEIIEKKYPRSKSWLSIETLRESHHTLPWLPGQGQTDEDCEDADRIVVFDDISPVLFDIPNDLYLDFVVSIVALDQDIGSFEFSCQSLQFKPVFEHINQVPHSSSVHLSNLIATQSNGISLKLLNHVIPHFTPDEQTVITLLSIEISLKSILRTRNIADIIKSEKKEIRKILKSFLKQQHNRSNLFIWAVYIQIERQMGKPEEYQSIAETAISMHSGSLVKWFVNEEVSGKKTNNAYVNGLVDIFVQYVEILLGVDPGSTMKLLSRTSGVTLETKNKVQCVISCLLEGKKVDTKNSSEIQGATLLRIFAKFPKCIQAVMKHFEKSLENLLSVRNDLLQICWCYSLFSYCSHGIQSGIDVYNQMVQMVHDMSTSGIHVDGLEERLLESKMRLILYHMTVSPSPLHILRENLDEALIKYPESSKFLSLFIAVETKARISGRINKYFDKQSRLAKCPLPVIFAVCDLIGHIKDVSDETVTGESIRDSSGLLNRARSWLENYINQTNNAHCPLIWRLYIQTEALCDKESRMKGLFYRAIQQCPWNKNLYKDGIQVLGEEKLQETVDLMIEKELRVYLPVEELDILIE